MKVLISTVLLVVSITLLTSQVNAQNSSVAIGDATPKANAVLYLKSPGGNQGLIIPIVATPGSFGEAGMIVYNSADQKVYYHNGTAWTAVGSGTGSSSTYTLSIFGNNLLLKDATSTVSTVPLAATAPTAANQFLMWDGSKWIATAISQDLTLNTTTNSLSLTNDATPVDLTQYKQTLTISGSSLSISGGNSVTIPGATYTGGTGITVAGTVITNTGDTNAVDDLTAGSTAAGDVTGLFSNLQLASGVVSSTEIVDGTIAAADLSSMSASSGQILKFNGTAWVPSVDDAGVGATPTLSSGQILIGDGSTNSAVALTGDASIVGGVMTISGNAITSTEITDGAIVAADLNAMSATNGQVLKFNGANWAPAVEAGATYTGGTGITVAGIVITNSGDTNATDDITTASTAAGDVTGLFSNLQLASGVVGSTEIADGTIVAADLNAMSATNGQVLKFNGTNWAPAVEAGTTYTGGAGITVVGTVISNAGDTNAADDLTTASTAAGDVTGLFSNLQLASGVVSSTEIADGTIGAADLSSMSASNGQILKFNGTAWVPSADDAGVGATPTLSSGQILIGDGSTNSAVALTGDATLVGGVMTISGNAITSTEITDGAIVAADLNAMSATNGQVLKFNGTNWAPAAEAGTTYTGGTGIAVAGSVINNTGDTNASDDLTTASSAAGDVTGLFSNLQLASGVVSSTEIADGTIVAADLNAMSATNGQVLKFNGTNWAPAAETGTTYTGGTGITVAGTVITNTGDTNAADDLTTASTATGDVTGLFSNLQLGSGAVTTTQILDGTIAATDLNAMSATSGQVLKFNGTAWAPAADVGGGDASTNTAISVDSEVALFSLTTGKLLKRSTGTGFAKLTSGVLSTQASVNLPTDVGASILPVANGGTGGTTWNGLLLGSGASIGDISTGASGQILRVAGTTPTWSNFAVTSADITDGQITGADLATNISIATTGNITTNAPGNLSIAGTSTLGGAATLTSLAGAGTRMVVANATGVLGTQTLPVSGWGLTGNSVTNPATNFVGTSDLQPLVFRTNNVEAMRIGTDLSVTIGTDNLANKKIIFYDITGNDHQFIGYGLGAAALRYQVDQASTDHIFYAGATTTTSTELMRIKGTGNVGIGIDPTQRLDVVGNVKFSGALMANNLPGTTGQVLTSAGPGVAPTWANPSGTTLISNAGSENLFAGLGTMLTGNNNAFFGHATGNANTTGNFNTFVGANSGTDNTIGVYNTFLGSGTGYKVTTASYNLFVGADAGFNLITGNLNTFVGFNAGTNGTGGGANTYVGNKAGESSASASFNTLLGERAGQITTGSENTFVGRQTGTINTTGQQNTLIGTNADFAVGAVNLQNATAIGYGAVVNNSFNMVFGTNLITGWGFGTQPVGGRAIVVGTGPTNGNGAFLTTGGTWTNASDRNKKENFTELNTNEILEKVKLLSVTRWNYKGEPSTVTHIGPMAQDFYSLFKTGDDDKSISTIDPSGVALLSIQELIKKIEALEAQNQKLNAEKGLLEAKVTSIEDQHKSLMQDVQELKRILGAEAKK